MSALLNFIGGAAFRAIWHDVSAYFTKKQDHKLEIERMRLQGDLDAAQHARNMQSQKQQAEIGYKTIEVQSEAAIGQIEIDAWRQAVANQNKPSGVRWADAWNAAIRPAFASCALLLWIVFEWRHMALNGWEITVWSLDMVGSIAGFFFADRTLKNRK